MIKNPERIQGKNMNKKERLSLYAALGFIGIVLTVTLSLSLKPENRMNNPLEKALSLYQKGDYQQAITYFAQADNMNVPEATFALGAMHLAGKGTAVNIPRALFYYQKAADNNYSPAQTTLALLYMEGNFVQKDSEKAIAWAKKAAELNDAEAQIMLARWFENGDQTEQDMGQAVRYYEMAARNGDVNAKTALSVIYKNGKGSVPANPYAAKRWSDSIQKQQKLENLFQNRPADFIPKATP